MHKKISIRQLKPGMYIADLGSDWMAHPYLHNSFMVRDEAQIEKLMNAGIHELYIDPRRGLDVADAPSSLEVASQIDSDLQRLAEESLPLRRQTVTEELARARQIHREANVIIRNIMQDVRLGKQVQLEYAQPVVEEINYSILRNSGALLSLARVKNKDDYTFQHSVAVCALQVAFCQALGLSAETTYLAGVGGLLHDVGKIRTPDTILNKPGRLTEAEFEIMKCHVVESRKILMETDGIAETSIQVAAQHHERHDGSGYPEGLAGAAISPMGQMAAICDVYDALTSERCYHRAMGAHEALRKLYEWSKFYFNAELVQQFLRFIGIYPVNTLVQLESGLLAVVYEQAENSLLLPQVQAFYDTRRKRYITPRLIDLSKPLGHGGGDRIVAHATAEQWKVDPRPYLLI